jgi:hypothetical protein
MAASPTSLYSGSRIRFKLADVVCPDPQQVIREMTPAVELTGQVVLLSDYGHRKDHFAIVSVQGLRSPLIVPVDQISLVDANEPAVTSTAV